MTGTIHSIGFTMEDVSKEYINDKLLRLEKFGSLVASVKTVATKVAHGFSVENHIVFSRGGDVLVVGDESSNLMVAIDLAFDKSTAKVGKEKEKLAGHHAPPAHD